MQKVCAVEIVLESVMAGLGNVRELILREFFPQLKLDEHSPGKMEALADACTDNEATRAASAFRVAAEIIHCFEADVVTGGEPEVAQFKAWERRLQPVTIRRLGNLSPEYLDFVVLTLYWLQLEGMNLANQVDSSHLTRRLAEYAATLPPPDFRLAAAIIVSRICEAPHLPEFATKAVEEFLANATIPNDETSRLLGDARSSVRSATDGSQNQYHIFTKACHSSNGVARFHNIGQCATIMETWRDAPNQLLPAIADHLWDVAAPVRAASAGAMHRAGVTANEYSRDLLELLRRPRQDLQKAVPERQIDMIRVNCLATLTALRCREVIAPLSEYLEAPYGPIPMSEIVADAAFCSNEILDDLARWLRIPAKGPMSETAARNLSATLTGLIPWGTDAAALTPNLITLFDAGVATSAVLDVLAVIGPTALHHSDSLRSRLNSPNIGPEQRAVIASILANGETTAIAEEAAATLVALFGHDKDHRSALRHLVDLEWPTSIQQHEEKIASAAWSMWNSSHSATRASLARILWKCGDRHPAFPETFIQEIGPCPSCKKRIDWLTDTGPLATPYRPILIDRLAARRRALCEHLTPYDRLVAADERYHFALSKAIDAIAEPMTS